MKLMSLILNPLILALTGGVKTSAGADIPAGAISVDVVVDDDDDVVEEPSSRLVTSIFPSRREGAGDVKGGADAEEGASEICLRRIMIASLA